MMNEMWDWHSSLKNIIDLWTIDYCHDCFAIVNMLSNSPKSYKSYKENLKQIMTMIIIFDMMILPCNNITSHISINLPGMKKGVWEPKKSGSSGIQTYQNIEMNENQRLWTNMGEPVQTMETRMAEIHPGISHWVIRPVKHPDSYLKILCIPGFQAQRDLHLDRNFTGRDRWCYWDKKLWQG